ncbi:Anaerobic dimethyl sulfoxide reductase chain A, molybdopterin-binding domain [hydrothermal vent metagenome]|uniref:Anaerobic dimethyl sulfoxide reductase chain A, molybdopterin-binding domain n=1 Tax=hydrothermal vent metagenome TaxID=652676 RepID=A0A3B0S320_9ZZZZ
MKNSDQSPKTEVSSYCYQCVAGPDLLKVDIKDGVATGIRPDFSASDIHPAGGKVCVKAYGLIQKTYNPNRILTPMKRTNPKKGRDQDPRFKPVSWDEALDTIAEKLNKARADGLNDNSGFPRVAASFGGGGTPTSYMGTFPAFLSAWGPVDMSFGSGQGVKCYHSEHLFGELWHRAFTVSPDTPLSELILSFGTNTEASGGVCGVKRHADARDRGVKRIQIEPHLSIAGACSAEWVPIKPKTDAVFLFAMIHILLHEEKRSRLDIPFLRDRTSSPYLLAPNGFYLRDKKSGKPLIWDLKTNKAVAFDTKNTEPALDGTFVASGLETGADNESWDHSDIKCQPAFTSLADHVGTWTPEWASKICDVPAQTIRSVATQYLDHAHIGETIDIDGMELPYRPVAISLGKTVNNGWGGYECCWGRTLLACLVGALEVPGGTLGTTVRLNRPADNRWSSVTPGPDGFMHYPMNPTSKDEWMSRPTSRHAHQTLIPLAANSPWSQALGPTHLAWMQQQKGFEHLPEPTQPDVWFVYRTNPAISFWDTRAIADVMATFPFTVCFAYTHDETNHMADILLPECTDLEGLQLIRIGGSKYIEQFWDYQGFALRDPATKPCGEARDFTWISTELARRTGLLEKYNAAINNGAVGVRLNGENYDFSLSREDVHDVEEIWDSVCKAASAEVTDGAESDGLEYFREHGFRVKKFSRQRWYLYPEMVAQELRFELPYQERLFRVGQQLGARLHEQGITWWDRQLKEYEPMPRWHDIPGQWEEALSSHFKINIDDYPFWLITARSMQYSWGGNAGLQMINEVAKNIAGHTGMIMNPKAAQKLGLSEGDIAKVTSPLGETKGAVVLRHGIRPDTLLMLGQFDHWATPYAKDLHVPSMNELTPMILELTDATGSGADLVKVFIERLGGNA